MKISTYENCFTSYTDNWSGWQSNFDVERKNSFLMFPYSVIIEGSFSDIDIAEAWCLKQVGKVDITSDMFFLKNYAGKLEEIKRTKNGLWKIYFYGKTSYDYGFCEFFFREKIDLEKFQKAVPNFF